MAENYLAEEVSEERLAEIISLEANAEKHQEYQSLTGNEARRQFVLDEFNAGKFSDASHIDFFLEQYSKEEINIPDTEKLKALLNGIDGYNGIEKRMQSLADRLVTSSLKQTVLRAGVTVPQGTVPTPDMFETKNLDLGLADTLKEIEKAEAKDGFAKMLIDAQKEAISLKYDGGSPKPEIVEQLTAAQENLTRSGWKKYVTPFRALRLRKVEKALKKIDKLAPHDISEGWNVGSYKGSRSEKLDDAIAALDIRIAQEERLAGMRWMSTNFLNKLGQKTLLTLGINKEKGDKPYAYGSKQRLINRVLKHSSAKDIDTYVAKLDSQLAAIAESEKSCTKLQKRGLEAKKKLLEDIKKQCETHKKTLAANKKEDLQRLGTSTTLRSAKEAEKFRTSLNKQVAEMRKRAKEDLAKDPMYMAYVKLHGEKAAAEKFNVEKMITADKVMEQIFNAQAKEGKLNGKTLEELKKALGMDKEEQQIDRPVTNESEQAQEAEQAQEKTPTQLGRETKGDSKPVDGYTEQDEAKLMVSPDGKRYDFITKDSDDKPREPSKEEIDKMVESLKDKNLRVTLEDSFSGQTQLAILEAMEKAGIEVADKEQVKERAQKRKEEEERAAAESASRESESKPKPAHEGDGATPKPEPVQESEKPKPEPVSADEKEQMNMSKVLESIAQNPETADEKIKLLARINGAELKADAQNSEYAKMLEDISNTFGKDSEESKFLRSMVTNKSMEQELASAGLNEQEAAEYRAFIKENATTGKEDIKANTQQRLENISQVTELAANLSGKSDEEIKEALGQSKLPAYAKQGVLNLVKLDKAEDIDSKTKATLRGQILGHVIEGKAQSRTVTKTVARTMDPRVVANQAQGGRK